MKPSISISPIRSSMLFPLLICLAMLSCNSNEKGNSAAKTETPNETPDLKGSLDDGTLTLPLKKYQNVYSATIWVTQSGNDCNTKVLSTDESWTNACSAQNLGTKNNPLVVNIFTDSGLNNQSSYANVFYKSSGDGYQLVAKSYDMNDSLLKRKSVDYNSSWTYADVQFTSVTVGNNTIVVIGTMDGGGEF